MSRSSRHVSRDSSFFQLKLAAEAFMEGDDVSIDAERSQVSLSKIFSWYREDFGENNDEVKDRTRHCFQTLGHSDPLMPGVT